MPRGGPTGVPRGHVKGEDGDGNESPCAAPRTGGSGAAALVRGRAPPRRTGRAVAPLGGGRPRQVCGLVLRRAGLLPPSPLLRRPATRLRPPVGAGEQGVPVRLCVRPGAAGGGG